MVMAGMVREDGEREREDEGEGESDQKKRPPVRRHEAMQAAASPTIDRRGGTVVRMAMALPASARQGQPPCSSLHDVRSTTISRVVPASLNAYLESLNTNKLA